MGYVSVSYYNSNIKKWTKPRNNHQGFICSVCDHGLIEMGLNQIVDLWIGQSNFVSNALYH